MTTSTATSTTMETQIQIALEVLKLDETGKTKAELAREYGVSPRSVTRYATKYEEEAMDLLTAEEAPEETKELETAFTEKKNPNEVDISLIIDKLNSEKVDADNKANTEIEEGRHEEPVELKNDFLEEVEPPKEVNVIVDEENTEEYSVESPTLEGSLSLNEIKNEDFYNDLNDNQKKLLEDFYSNKSEMINLEERKGKRGRPSKGVKSIRFITMEIIESHKAEGTLVKENRDLIISQIMNATGHNEKQAKKYFSGYKKVFGGWNK